VKKKKSLKEKEEIKEIKNEAVTDPADDEYEDDPFFAGKHEADYEDEAGYKESEDKGNGDKESEDKGNDDEESEDEDTSGGSGSDMEDPHEEASDDEDSFDDEETSDEDSDEDDTSEEDSDEDDTSEEDGSEDDIDNDENVRVVKDKKKKKAKKVKDKKEKRNDIILYSLLGVFVIAAIIAVAFKAQIADLLTPDINYSKYITFGDYKNITLKSSDVDSNVQQTIDNDLATYTTYEQIKEGKVKDGDTVNIFYVGKIDGKKFDGGSLTSDTNPDGYNLTIGSHSFIDGFEDQLIGKKIGDTVDIKVTFPEDYQSADVAGKDAVFTVTLNYKQGDKVDQEFNDDFVKQYFPQYKSADDMKESLRKDAIKSLAWSEIIDQSKVISYPKGTVKAMYDQLYATTNNYLTTNGYTLEQYLQANSMTSEEYEKELTKSAKSYEKNELIIKAIAQKEKIRYDENSKEYKAKLKEYLTQYSVSDQTALDKKIKDAFGTDSDTMIKDELRTNAVRDLIAENTKVE
jgi:trigger factor